MVVMLAIIGAKIDAGIAYWIFYGIWCAIKVMKAVHESY